MSCGCLVKFANHCRPQNDHYYLPFCSMCNFFPTYCKMGKAVFNSRNAYIVAESNGSKKQQRNKKHVHKCCRHTSVSIFALSFITVASGGGALTISCCKLSLGLQNRITIRVKHSHKHLIYKFKSN